MFYIRTIKNRYDIDIIIDSTDNQEFVQTSGLDWIELSPEITSSPENGLYYYDGKVISTDSPEYDEIIVPIIDSFEEPLRIEREEREAKEQEEYELLLSQQFEELLDTEPPTDFIPPEPPDPTDEEAIAAAEAAGAVDPRSLPNPGAYPILGVESTEENLRDWEKNYLNISSLISALSANDYLKIANNVVIFDPAHEFPDGHTQSHFPFPEDNVDGYIQHLTAVKQTYKDLLDKICTDLNLPPVPEA